MKRIAFFLIVLLGIVVSCDDNNSDELNNQNQTIPLDKAGQKVIEASNNFTFKIFSELEQEYPEENIFFSPLSMSMALSMALNGANGETKQQIKNVVDFGNYTDTEINLAFKNLQDAFIKLDEAVEISMANSAWYREDLVLLDNYRNVLMDFYYAEIGGFDFSKSSTLETINNWIADKTKDKITNMISELDPATVLVLVNAIYFNGTWKYEFKEEETYNGSFIGLQNEAHNCKMMQLGKIKTKYLVDADKSIATLPYGDGNFEMVMYMPTDGSSLQTVLSELNAGALSSLLNESTSDSVAINLPKFKIETETISLTDMLKNLGMIIPFTGAANFSNIFETELDIYISDVFHKAFIEVNEVGTEAAAATVVVFEYTSIGDGSQGKVIVFDRPFIFFIREVSTSEILFAGKLIKPTIED